MNEIEKEGDTIREALECTDVNKLYHLQIELSQDIGVLYGRHQNAETVQDQITIKAKIKTLEATLSVVKDRIPEVKTKLQDDVRENYNFRLAAKRLLKQETYKRISMAARGFTSEIRKMSQEELE